MTISNYCLPEAYMA